MARKSCPCIRCKNLIPVERLEALPETRLCLQCSAQVGSDFHVVHTRVSTGKAGSLKKNYADIDVSKRRRDIRPLDEEEQE